VLTVALPYLPMSILAANIAGNVQENGNATIKRDAAKPKRSYLHK